MKSFTLEVTTQEKHLLTETVTSLTAMTEAGEVTILAGHIPLLARVARGEMSYKSQGKEFHFAVTGGFIDVSPRGIVTILADSAIRSDLINVELAQKAVVDAQKALEEAPDKQTSLKIELELRSAVLMSKVAQKHRFGN